MLQHGIITIVYVCRSHRQVIMDAFSYFVVSFVLCHTTPRKIHIHEAGFTPCPSPGKHRRQYVAQWSADQRRNRVANAETCGPHARRLFAC